jgi:hypothetical protein
VGIRLPGTTPRSGVAPITSGGLAALAYTGANSPTANTASCLLPNGSLGSDGVFTVNSSSALAPLQGNFSIPGLCSLSPGGAVEVSNLSGFFAFP